MYSSCEDDFSMEEGSMGRKRRFGSSESTRRSPRNMRVHLKTPFTVSNQIRRTVLNSWINILLVCAPIGIVLYYHESVSPAAVFVVNLLAIVSCINFRFHRLNVNNTLKDSSCWTS